MQTRTAAITAVFFLVVAAGAYAFIGSAQQPGIAIEEENRDHVLQGNGTFTLDDGTVVRYSVNESEGSGSYTNESERLTATLENASNVTYEGTNYTLRIPNETNPSQFTLRELQTVDRPTVTQNGTTFVVVNRNGTRVLVPRNEYLPEPQTQQFQEGDTFQYQNNSTTVGNVSSGSVLLTWTADVNHTIDFAEGENVTVKGTPYVANFPNPDTLVLTDNFEDYNSDVDRRAYFQERVNGLWGVFILSLLAAIVMVGMALLPSRY